MKTKICTKCKKEKHVLDFCRAKKYKDGLNCWCKACAKEYRDKPENKERILQQKKEYRKNFPWKMLLKSIKQRCNNHKCKDYKNYGGRGIKCLIIVAELKFLWFRDKAYLMDKPSIDRKKNDKDYTFDNCQFIELNINSGKDKRKPVLQLNLEDIFIKEWESIKSAAQALKIQQSHIGQCCLGKLKTTGGYKWKYKRVYHNV